jgi:hypothetical protein
MLSDGSHAASRECLWARRASASEIPSRLILRAAVLGVSLIVWSAAAGVAHAGSYRVWSCTDANATSVSTTDGTAGWSPQSGPATKENRCSSADPNPAGRYLLDVLTAQAGMQGEVADGWTFTAPTNAELRGVELWWQGSTSSGFRIDIVSPNRNGYSDILANHPYPFGSDSPYATANYWSLPGPGYPNVLPTPAPTSFQVRAVCEADCGSRAGLSAWFKIYRARVTLGDDTAPSGGVSGPLVDRPVLRGVVSATVDGHDIGGGVYLARLYVDDQLADQKTFPGQMCQDHDPGGDPYEFAAPTPCPSSATATLSLDTRQLPGDALHRLRIEIVDAAGNATTLANQQAYVLGSAPDGFYDPTGHRWFNPDATADAPRAANGQGAGPANPVLSFGVRRGLGNKRRTTYVKSRVVSLRGRPTVIGRLRDKAGNPVVGARLWLGECAKGGTCRITQGPFVSSRHGGFSTRLIAGRPTRQVHLLYFPWTDSNEVYTAKTLRLGVRARVTLRIRPRVVRNGRTVRFAGSIRVPALASGLTGTLQTLDGASWRVFKVVHIDSSGRFSARYRFRRSSGVRYRFRIRISGSQPGMAYDSGISPIVRVRVR